MSNHTSEEAAHVGGTTKQFMIVWIGLLVLTALEIFLAYEQLPTLIFLTAVVGLSVVKAAMIIAYFMHLKFERFSLFMTLFPMLIMCILLMFITMPDSFRSLELRPLP